MSIFQEYEEIRNLIGHEMYDTIGKYLDIITKTEDYEKFSKELSKIPGEQIYKKIPELKKQYNITLLSDVLYKESEWDKYFLWFNENYKHRKVEILNVWESDFDDIRCNARLYKDNKMIANIIASYDNRDIEKYVTDVNSTIDKSFINKVLKNLIYDDFDKYAHLPKLSKCSKLLKEIYDFVCESDSSMCHIDNKMWKEDYADRYDENAINKLQKEIEKYNLDDIVVINDGEYKILGFSDLETRFNDDRKLIRNKERER